MDTKLPIVIYPTMTEKEAQKVKKNPLKKKE